MTNTLVMLQTNSNQPFIFSSPRLREQIGASFEITLLSHWVQEAAFDLKLPSVTTDEKGKKVLPSSFWVSDSSGKVIVRFTEDDGVPEALARTLIREVTLRALTDAPGLDVTGVFIETTSDSPNPKDLDKLDHVFGEYSLNRRPAAARFPQFPYLIRGEESALPASAVLTDEDCKAMRCYARETLNVPLFTNENTDFSPPTQTDQEAQESPHAEKPDSKDAQDDEEGEKNTQVSLETTNDKILFLSLPSRVKRAWSRSARRLQLNDVVSRWSPKNEEDRLKIIESLCEDPFQLEKAFQDVSDDNGATGTRPEELSSVGVIHIDGNGVGAIMRDLGKAFERVDDQLDSFERSTNKRKKDPCDNELADAPRDRKENPCDRAEDPFQWFVMEVNYRLDRVVNQAVAKAWKTVYRLATGKSAPESPPVVPVVPVLVGGDDVTVYTDGRYAIPFAEAYIQHYECLTDKDALLRELAVMAGAKEAGPLTASAGVAIVGRNFPFHIAYDLAEELVSRGKKLGKKKLPVPCSTINFHVLRDATVLDAEETLDEYKGRTQRPFLVGHYAAARISYPATASSSLVWNDILRAVAVFDGKDPNSPTKTLGDPFPRARARRIVKLLAQEIGADEADKTPRACLGYVLNDNEETLATREDIKADDSQDEEEKITKRCKHPICTILGEWSDAQENASGGKGLVKRLTTLPSQARLAEADQATATISAADSADGQADEELSERQRLIGDCVEQVRWLLDLIDLSENLPDGYIAYIASLICPDGGGDADGDSSPDPADDSTTGGAK